MELGDRFRVNGPGVTHEVIDGEAVIINLETGNYYSLDLAGAEIWTLLAARASIGSIVERLAQSYACQRSELESAVVALVAQLDREQLIVPCSTAESEEPAVASSTMTVKKRAFQAPLLQKFTDMKELLLLDPIHEVDERGWPYKKPDVQA